MSKYPKDTRPPEATCPEGLEDLVEWERSRADYHEAWREKLEARNKTLKARVEELEAEIKLCVCNVMRGNDGSKL